MRKGERDNKSIFGQTKDISCIQHLLLVKRFGKQPYDDRQVFSLVVGRKNDRVLVTGCVKGYEYKTTMNHIEGLDVRTHLPAPLMKM
jgi:hypothetical protein